MNEMIIRAKAAALLALARHGVPADIQGLMLTGDERGSVPPGALHAAVVAVMEALREPTEAMLSAGWSQTRALTPEQRMSAELADAREAFRFKLRARYRAMIDEILTPNPNQSE